MNCLVSKVSSTNQFLYWHKKTPEIQLHTKAWSFLSFTHGLWLPGSISQNVYIHTCMYIYTCMYSMLEVLTLMAFWKTHIDVNWQTAQNMTTSQKTESHIQLLAKALCNQWHSKKGGQFYPNANTFITGQHWCDWQ